MLGLLAEEATEPKKKKKSVILNTLSRIHS